jgi:hypothetical protein
MSQCHQLILISISWCSYTVRESNNSVSVLLPLPPLLILPLLPLLLLLLLLLLPPPLPLILPLLLLLILLLLLLLLSWAFSSFVEQGKHIWNLNIPCLKLELLWRNCRCGLYCTYSTWLSTDVLLIERKVVLNTRHIQWVLFSGKYSVMS